MRKFLALMTALLCMFSTIQLGAAQAGAATPDWLNSANLAQGVVGIHYAVKANVTTKVMISHNNDSYTYTLTPGKQAEEVFPLQLGNGDYTVSILENIEGKQYKVVGKQSVALKLADSKIVFLNSIQNIDWNGASQTIMKAKELTRNKKTDAEKVRAIYDYIVSNIKYDYKLAANPAANYIPQLDRTLSSKKDICYGYSALMAGMLRSLNIPTKLVMGQSSFVDTYHAWNEVLLDGKWVIIDTTVDAGLAKTKKDMIKQKADYTTAKQY